MAEPLTGEFDSISVSNSCWTACGRGRQLGELPNANAVTYQRQLEDFMRSILLWAIGIPLPIIIILWLVTGHA